MSEETVLGAISGLFAVLAILIYQAIFGKKRKDNWEEGPK